jgi:hypothetical protein
MPFIEGVRLQTADFTMRADRITGRQLWAALERLGAHAAGAGGAGAARLNPIGPGAIRSPAEQFLNNGVSPALADPCAPGNGFAAGGADNIRQLDTRAVIGMLLRFVQHLVGALLQMLRGDSGVQGADQGDAGGGTPAGAGSNGACASPASPEMSPPVTPGEANFSPAPTAARIQPQDDRMLPDFLNRYAQRQPVGQDADQPGAARRILARIGAGALNAAAGAAAGGVPGAVLGAAAGIRGGAQCDAAQGSPRGPNGSPRPAGGSLEDQIAAFFRDQLQQIEQELKAAMQEADQVGEGDSRAAAASKVQQLVNRRSEMVEMLTNALKTLYESSMTVNRNIK